MRDLSLYVCAFVARRVSAGLKKWKVASSQTLVVSVLEGETVFFLSRDSIQPLSRHAGAFDNLHALADKRWDPVTLYHISNRRAKVPRTLSRFLYQQQ